MRYSSQSKHQALESPDCEEDLPDLIEEHEGTFQEYLVYAKPVQPSGEKPFWYNKSAYGYARVDMQ